MALDPQVTAVLELVAKANRPAYNTLSPKDARQLFIDTRPASTPTPPQIGSVKDVTAQGPHAAIPLRVYRPAGVADGTRVPAYLFFHGGGWVIGDVNTHDVLCRQLTAASGASVISVDYRLAPEHKFPAAADDSWAATTWVVAHAAELGLDASRLAVGGDSAGGNLAAVVALMARDAGGPAIKLQTLIYPVTDLSRATRSTALFSDGYHLTVRDMDWFADLYLSGSDVDTTDFARALLAGRDLERITIRGAGVVDMNRDRRHGPKPIALERCRFVTVQGITIVRSPNYCVSLGG